MLGCWVENGLEGQEWSRGPGIRLLQSFRPKGNSAGPSHRGACEGRMDLADSRCRIHRPGRGERGGSPGKQSNRDGEVEVLDLSCLSRASFESVRQLSLGVGMRPELWDFAES